MYYCLLRELVYHLNLNYTKFRLASLEVSSVLSMQTNARTCYHAVEETRKPHHIPGDHAGKKNARDKA